MKDQKYNIQYTNKFKKQYSKLLNNRNFKKTELEKVLRYLANNQPLPEKYRNHLLTPKSERSMGMPCTTGCVDRVSKIKK